MTKVSNVLFVLAVAALLVEVSFMVLAMAMAHEQNQPVKKVTIPLWPLMAATGLALAAVLVR